MASGEKWDRITNADISADQYDFAEAENFLNAANSELNRATRVYMSGNNAAGLFVRDLSQDIEKVSTIYNQKKLEREQQLAEQQKAMQAEEARLKAQEQARIAQQKKDAESLSLLGQKDLTGVAKTYGTTDLGAAIEIKRQREENARKQVQSEKIESMSLRIARGQRGRRGVATGSTGGRGFFERYFQ